MSPEIIYLLKVNVGITLFYAFYKLFCCRDTFFVWRRIVLLSFLLLSFFYPFLDIYTWVSEQPVISELTDYYALQMMIDDTTAPLAVQASTLAMPDGLTVLSVVYLIGLLFFLLRFILRLCGVGYMWWISKSVMVDGILVRSLSTPSSPFSFGRWIFLYLPGLGEKERMEILTHEHTHVSQIHSLDVVLSELVNILCWMNPFSWFLKEEIRLNLEYLADRKVIEKGNDLRSYQYHLLGVANNGKQVSIYSNFNVSHLKSRIVMMNKKRTCSSRRFKYALFAPLAAVLLLASNVEAVARHAANLMREIPIPNVIQLKDLVKEIKIPVLQVHQRKYKSDEKCKFLPEYGAYELVEEPAKFPEGVNRCLKYIRETMIYPELALKEKRQGRVVLSFVVNEGGSIRNIKVLHGEYPDLNEEAIRIVNSMPRWIPGKIKGEAVPSRYILPLSFRLP